MSNTTDNTMQKFKITVKETLEREIEVEAEDLNAALAEVQGQYDNEDITLDADDFTGVDIFESDAE